jgi:hypothetical protein
MRSLTMLKNVLAAFELSTGRSRLICLRRAEAAGHRVLITVLLGNTSRHRSAGSLLWGSPHHPIGRTPARSPSRGGALFRMVDRSCVQRAAGPDCYPHLKACPHAQQSGPHPANWISEISVRLFMARTLAQRPFCLLERPLPTSCGKRATSEQVKSAPVGIDWNGFRNSDLFEVGGAVPFGRRSCPAERQGAGALDFPAARKFVKSILPDWFHSTRSRNVARKPFLAY